LLLVITVELIVISRTIQNVATLKAGNISHHIFKMDTPLHYKI